MAKIKRIMINALKENSVIFVLILFVIISALISNVFLSWNNLTNILRQQSALTLVSMGMLLVILTGGIDLSVGSLTALSCVTFATFICEIYPDASIGHMLIGMLVALLFTTLCGTFTGMLVAYSNMAPFVASLAMMTIGRGLAYIISNGEPVRYESDTAAGLFLDKIGTGKIPGIELPWPVLIALIALVAIALIMRFTAFGRMVIAIGSNENAVRLGGIEVRKYKMSVYTISGLFCGIAGLMIVARSGVGVPSTGEGQELDALASCVVGGASLSGGKGNAVNTCFGVLVFGLISNIMDLLSFPAYPQQVVKGIIIIAAVLTQGVAAKGRKRKAQLS